MIPDLPQQLILLLRVGCGGILLILLVNEGTLKEMHRAFTVVDDADYFTVFKAQRGVGLGQTMELLFTELVQPPGEIPLFKLDVYTNLTPVLRNLFDYLHDSLSHMKGMHIIGRFVTFTIPC